MEYSLSIYCSINLGNFGGIRNGIRDIALSEAGLTESNLKIFFDPFDPEQKRPTVDIQEDYIPGEGKIAYLLMVIWHNCDKAENAAEKIGEYLAREIRLAVHTTVEERSVAKKSHYTFPIYPPHNPRITSFAELIPG